MRSSDYLLAALLILSVGSVLAIFLGVWKTVSNGVGTNLRGEPFPSGYRYSPGQISFMCMDPSTPEGMTFRAFLLAAAVCLLMSEYPWKMSNVRVSGIWFSSVRCFLTLRHLVPAVSLIVVVMVHLPDDRPDHESSLGASLQNAIHSSSAVLLFVGYAFFELWTLKYGIFEHPLPGRERFWRYLFVYGSIASFVGFMIPYSMVINASALGLCCDDEWRVPTMQDAAAAQRNGHPGTAVIDWLHEEKGVPMLLNTASHTVRLCKYLAFSFEVLDVLCVGGSLLSIWAFCPETWTKTEGLAGQELM